MRTNRRPLLSLFLVAALLVAQLGTVAHRLAHGFELLGRQADRQVTASHGTDRAQEHEHANDADEGVASCLACLSFASVGTGAHSDVQITFAPPPRSGLARWQVRPTVTSLTPQQHRARAPPVFS